MRTYRHVLASQQLLAAFIDVWAARTAATLARLATVDDPGVTAERLYRRWAADHPHVAGDLAVHLRVARGLAVLDAAGIVSCAGPNHLAMIVHINHFDHLRMAGRNLFALQDKDGWPLPETLWTRRPEVPAHLLHLLVPSTHTVSDNPEAFEGTAPVGT